MQPQPSQPEMLLSAWEADPGNPDAGLKLAQFYADHGSIGKARDIYRELLCRDENNYAILLDYGNSCVQCGDLEDAAGAFGKLTVLRPNRIEGWNNLGIVALRRDRHDEAKTAFERVLELEPDNPGALVNMGNYHSSQNQFAIARDFFAKAVAVRPDFADAWYNLGNAQLGLKEYAAASQSYAKALRYNVEFASAAKNRGVAHERLGDLDEAERSYLRALTLSKGDAGLLINLANVYTRSGKHSLAKRYYLRAVRMRPRDMAGWMGLRHLALVKGDVETYVRSTLAVLQRLDSAAIAESLRVLRDLGQHDKVDLLVMAADRAGKRGEEIDAERLLTYQRTGKSPERADKLLRRLLTSEGNDRIGECLAEYYHRMGDWAAAIAQVSRMAHPPISSLRRLWDARIRLNDWGGAEREIREYLGDHGDCAECWYLLARIEAGRGRLDRARQYLAAAMENGFVDIEAIERDQALSPIYRELIGTSDTSTAHRGDLDNAPNGVISLDRIR